MKYDGKYHVSEKNRSQGRRAAMGEIIIHKTPKGQISGAIILRCPFCGALQFIAAKVEGPADAPTVTTPIVCSCRVRCRKTFRIRSGVVHDAEEPRPDDAPTLPNSLVDAGVFFASKK